MRRLLPAIAALALLAAPASASAACADADLRPTAANLDQIADATFCLHNEERAEVGLPPLDWNEQLAESARGHSLDMVTQLFFEHDNLDGQTPADRIAATGYLADWSGENIAWGSGELATPSSILDAWMNSEDHRENILRPEFDDVGIGIAFGAPEDLDIGLSGATYTANFGSTSAADTDDGFDDDGYEEPDRTVTPDNPVDTPEQTSTPKPTKAEKRRKALKKCLKKAGKAKKNKRKKRKRCRRLYG